jgi:hypothetical protein
MSDLADRVRDMERRHQQALHLLGDICTTLTLPVNVQALSAEPAGQQVVDMARGWAQRWRQLEQAEG